MTIEISFAPGRDFPEPGQKYHVDFGNADPFVLTFVSDRSLCLTWLEGDRKGISDTVRFTRIKLREGLYLLCWRQRDGSVHEHVEDFARGVVYANIVKADGTVEASCSRLALLS